MIQLLLIVSFLLYPQNHAKLLTSISLRIDILSIKPCDSSSYPVKVNDVAIEIDEGKLNLSGTLYTTVDLSSPIKATIEVKKDELGMWIKVPCVDQMGSCTYDDLCAHGVPVGNSCPRQFIDSKVPCRCPIPKGTYTIKPSVELPMSSYALSSVYAGKYWAKATFVDKEINLACYNVYFNIIDKVVEDEKEYGQIYYNNIDPFVELVR